LRRRPARSEAERAKEHSLQTHSLSMMSFHGLF
jgi:hypothetical protein